MCACVCVCHIVSNEQRLMEEIIKMRGQFFSALVKYLFSTSAYHNLAA